MQKIFIVVKRKTFNFLVCDLCKEKYDVIYKYEDNKGECSNG